MVRKLFIAVLLLALVLVISYIQVSRNDNGAESVAEPVAVESHDTTATPTSTDSAVDTATVPEPPTQPTTATEPPRPDTLSDALKQTIRDYCRQVFDRLPDDLTITERTAAAQNIIKEAASRFALDERKVSNLWQPPAITPVSGKATVAKQQPQAEPSVADQVESFFKRRTAALPKDLTQVETRIALDEIRKETAEAYSLSLDEVYDIWRQRELTSVSVEALDDVGIEKTTTPGNDAHRRQIAKYYRERFDSLPANLTEYERTVAIAELKYETAAHFSISLSEFEKIWQEYSQTDS